MTNNVWVKEKRMQEYELDMFSFTNSLFLLGRGNEFVLLERHDMDNEYSFLIHYRGSPHSFPLLSVLWESVIQQQLSHSVTDSPIGTWKVLKPKGNNRYLFLLLYTSLLSLLLYLQVSVIYFPLFPFTAGSLQDP
jgi:hypothetical protein